MVYRNVVAAVVRALASETISSAGGCEVDDVRVQSARIPGEISGREAAFLFDCMVHALLHKQLVAGQWSALVAKYSTNLERKHDAIDALARSVVSPAPERFRNAAVITWAMPKLPGSDGKRSINVLPAGWYVMDNWCEDPVPVKTQERWRRQIRRDLERSVDDALMAAQELLDAQGLIRPDAA